MSGQRFLAETWFDPRVAVRPSPIHGRGLFATAPIAVGETVMIWGGVAYSLADLAAGRVPRGVSYSFVDEGLLLAGPADGPDYFVNHSCDPTLWMADEVTVIARRAVAAGEELTGDYALWEGDADYTLAPCRCGSARCRGRITGDDWRRPELQDRYRGHFLPYLERRIARPGTSPGDPPFRAR